MVFYQAVERDGEMHDRGGRGRGRLVLASSSFLMDYGLVQGRVVGFVSSLMHGVREVENAVSLKLLVMVEDFAEPWRHGGSERVRVFWQVERVTFEAAF